MSITRRVVFNEIIERVFIPKWVIFFPICQFKFDNSTMRVKGLSRLERLENKWKLNTTDKKLQWYACPYGNCPLIKGRVRFDLHVVGHDIDMYVDLKYNVLKMRPPTANFMGPGSMMRFNRKCSDCGEFKGSIQKHVEHHKLSLDDFPGKGDKYICSSLMCTGLRTYVSFWEHLRFHQDDVICNECRGRFKNYGELELHNFICHKKHCIRKYTQGDVYCPITGCSQLLKSHLQIYSHYTNNHRDLCLMCSYKQKTSNGTFSDVKEHEESRHKFFRKENISKDCFDCKKPLPAAAIVDLTEEDDVIVLD